MSDHIVRLSRFLLVLTLFSLSRRASGDDNACWANWAGTSWSSFSNVGSSVTLMSGIEPTLIIRAGAPLDIFGWGGPYDSIHGTSFYHSTFNGTSWNGWQAVPNGALISPSGAASWGQNRIDLFGVGGDGHMYHTSFDGTNWSATWDDRGVPAGLTCNNGASGFKHPNGSTNQSFRPAVISRGLNRLDVIGVACDSNVYWLNWDGQQWGSWTQIYGGGDSISSPAMLTGAMNTIDAAVMAGPGHAIEHLYFDGTNWHQENIGGNLKNAGAGSGTWFALGSWGSGRLDVLGAYNKAGYLCFITHKWYGPFGWSVGGPDNDGWFNEGGPQRLNGTSSGVTTPGIVSTATNRYEFYRTDENLDVWHKVWNGSSWSSWSNLGHGNTGASSGPVAVSTSSTRIDLVATSNIVPQSPVRGGGASNPKGGTDGGAH